MLNTKYASAKIGGRESSLDMIKVIATILIVFHHYAQTFPGDYTFIRYFDGKFYFGHLVELFFIISGYFSLHMLGKIQSGADRFPAFLKKRTCRLIPMLMITAIADQIFKGIFLIVTETPNDGRISLWGTIISGLGIQTGGAFLPRGVNNPTWYVSVLLICYVLMFFLTWLSKRGKVPCWYFFAGMVLLGASSLTYSLNHPFLNFYTSRGYMAFFFGILLGEANRRWQLHKRISFQIVNTLLLTVFWVSFALLPSAVDEDMRLLLTFLVWPGTILLMKAPIIERFVHSGFWGILAKYSFNAYVWHSPLLKLLGVYTGITGQRPFDTRTAMLVFTASAFAIGIVSHYLIEKPIANWLNRIGSARKHAAVAAE